ncbi:MAG: hypothetical protein ABSB00_00625 [Minisyncoccia bacterium]
MRKEVGAKELLNFVGTTVEKIRKTASGNWYLEYHMTLFGDNTFKERSAEFVVFTEFSARFFAEEFVKLPTEIQKDLLAKIIDYVKGPGDVLRITGNRKEGDRKENEKKMDVQVIRLASDHPRIINLFVTH